MEKLTRSAATEADAALALLGGLNSQTDGVELAYQVLDLLVARYHLSEAHLVLRPGSLSPQIFVHGRRHVTPERADELARRPSGLYASPDVVPITVQDALTGSCEMALAAHAGRRRAEAAVEGLSSRRAMEEAVRRAASCSARFRWPFTMLLLGTDGPAPAGERWRGLAGAVRGARRVCDEAGTAGPGRALAILAGAGPEDVEPYVDRLRETLQAGLGDQVRLLVGAATAPADSVDPVQLWRLCEERLVAGAPEGGHGQPAPGGGRQVAASEVELELRCLPDVVSVGVAGLTGPDPKVRSVTVVTRCRNDELRQLATQMAAERLGDVPVAVLDGRGEPGPPLAGSMVPANGWSRRANGMPLPAEAEAEAGGGGGGRAERRAKPGGKAKPGAERPPVDPEPARVALVRSAFDRTTGTSEVVLSWHGVEAAGRATGSPMASAAQATLVAVEALGAEIPYYLTSVERTSTHPGSPVVVALAARQGADRPEDERRVGVAPGGDEVEAASRATLAALNRHLSRASGDR